MGIVDDAVEDGCGGGMPIPNRNFDKMFRDHDGSFWHLAAVPIFAHRVRYPSQSRQTRSTPSGRR